MFKLENDVFVRKILFSKGKSAFMENCKVRSQKKKLYFKKAQILQEGIKDEVARLYLERCTLRYKVLVLEELYATKMKRCNPQLVSSPF